MKTLFITVVLTTLKLSHQQNETYRINDGASTSRRDHLSRCENCELEICATRTINLLLSEDTRGENLTYMMSNRFEELETFNDEIFSNILSAQYTTSDLSNIARQKTRLDYFFLHIRKVILATFLKTSAQHYHHKLSYEFDSKKRIILVREFLNFDSNSSNCLCGNDQERTILNEPFLLPNDIPTSNSSYTAYQINSDDSEFSAFETKQYHIIPLCLIREFFKKWLSGPLDNVMHSHFNGCMNTLYGRLKRSMQKLVIVLLEKTNQFSQDAWYRIGASIDDENIYSEIFARGGSWLPGNIFLGPKNRGPLDPTFNSYDDHYDAFDLDAATIIYEDRYYALLELFYKLYNFTFVIDLMPPLSRLTDGFILFVSISNLLIGGRITPMNPKQWVFRKPEEEELRRMNVESREAIKEFMTHRYWTVNKPFFRFSRSINKILVDVDKLQQKSSVKGLRQQWSMFVTTLMQVQVEARSRGESMTWFCNFERIYNDYLFHQTKTPKNMNKCQSCNGFDEYLYSKISRLSNWEECNNGSNIVSDWCEAWKRVKISLNANRRSVDGFLKVQSGISRNEQPLVKDFETLMGWLSLKTLKIRKNFCQKNVARQVIPSQTVKIEDFLLFIRQAILGTFYIQRKIIRRT